MALQTVCNACGKEVQDDLAYRLRINMPLYMDSAAVSPEYRWVGEACDDFHACSRKCFVTILEQEIGGWASS